MVDLLAAERAFAAVGASASDDENRARLRRMKRLGFSDRQLAELWGQRETDLRALRHRLGVRPAYKVVDTCAGEFPSATPYLYCSYDEENEARGVGDRTVVILGSGPNRIGQGVEFDYLCVRAALAFRELGYRTVMVNSNPETVSTDFDISDALYFEPLTLEDVLEIVAVEQPLGVVVQLGGQTPLRLARALEAAGVPILGTSPEAIDVAEDRGRFEALDPGAGGAAAPERHGVFGARKRSRWRARWAIRSWSAPATCSAAGRWRSSTTTPRCRATSPARRGWRRSTRC